jgi:hypothetical protein
MYLTGLAHKAKFLLNQNSSTILTGVGVVGTIGTAYLTGRASFRAADVLAKENAVINTANDNVLYPVYLTKAQKVKLTWRFYVIPVATGVGTVGAIIFAHRIDAKRVVALTVASGISERALKEYREKVVERLGDRQDTKLRDEIAQDRVNKLSGGEVVVTDGKVLCMDMLTGRFFDSTMEELKRAENKINHELNHHAVGCSLSEFYDEIGLSPTAYSEMVGWNPDKMVELKISAAVAPNGQPCLAVDFEPHPFDNYWRLHE